MQHFEAVAIVKSFPLCNEEEILSKILNIISNLRFSTVLYNYNMSKEMFAQCLDAINRTSYYKEEMFAYANKHNKKIINEAYAKIEIFK